MSHIDLPNDAGKEITEFGLTCRRKHSYYADFDFYDCRGDSS